jgi:steroid delta-isomerase-like uncharacterized protein
MLALAFAACAKETPMNDHHAQLARSYFEMWNTADAARADDLVAPDLVGHVNAATLHGAETLRQRIANVYAIYSDAHFAIEDVVVAGDRAVVRWRFEGTHSGPAFGKAATGNRVSVNGVNIFRIADGKIAELWVSADDLGELEQLGVIEIPKSADR